VDPEARAGEKAHNPHSNATPGGYATEKQIPIS